MEKLMLTTSSGDYLIDTTTIVRVEASSNYSKLFFNNGKTIVTAKLLSWFEEKLEQGSFTRLHRSHLVNNNFLQANQCISKQARLKDGIIVPVSKRKKKMVLQKLAAACLFFFITSLSAFSQNVGIGTTTPHASAVLDVVSNNKGLSIPSMTTAQRNAIPNPKPGLLVFDLDKNTIYMYDGGQWLALLFTVSESLIPPIVRTASDGAVGDQFGLTVSISGNYAVIGAPYDNVGTNVNQGSAYIFFRSSSVWSEQAKLVASDGAAGDLFGYSVSISGSYVIAGAYLDNIPAVDAGSAYVFIRSGTVWTEQAKLTASNATTDDHFGYSVAISGSYAAVGAKDDDIGANTNEGSVCFFNRSGTVWTQQDNVVAPLGAAGDFFGFSVAISGDYALIGANEDDVGANIEQGSAHVFLRSGTNWGYHAMLTEPSGNAGDHFGESVAIDGNYAVIGAPYLSSYAGSSAFIFLRNGATWGLQATLLANPIVFTAPVNRFGISVAIDGDYVIIGATQVIVGGNNNQGAAYLFIRDGVDWLFVRRIEDSGGGPAHLMGRSAGISGLNCIIGASGADAQKGKILFLNVE